MASCYEEFGNVYCNGDAWDDWVRWLVLGLIIAGALAVFILFSCITARRRRRMGYRPYYGTGWTLGRTPAGHAPASYNYNQQPYYNNSNNPAPPAYAPPQENGYYGPRNDVELQQPQATYGGAYRSGEGVYDQPKR